MRRLSRSFYTRDVLDVAPLLLGKQIVINKNNVVLKYTINEVEAYRGGEDLACHASKGRTNRTRVMYEEGGKIYVYLIYGIYWMLNIVTGEKDNPQAVLIRGVVDCNGPGRVGKLLGIDKSLYAVDLANSNQIWLEANKDKKNFDILQKPRIGIDYAGTKWKDKPWRYILNEIQ